MLNVKRIFNLSRLVVISAMTILLVFTGYPKLLSPQRQAQAGGAAHRVKNIPQRNRSLFPGDNYRLGKEICAKVGIYMSDRSPDAAFESLTASFGGDAASRAY